MEAADTACGTDLRATGSAGGADWSMLGGSTAASAGNGGGATAGRFFERPDFRGGGTVLMRNCNRATGSFGWIGGLGGCFCDCFAFFPVADAAAVMSQTTAITTSGIHPPSARKIVRASVFMIHTDQALGPSVGWATASRMAVSACTLRSR